MRVFNWDSKLIEFAEEVRGNEYEWGETDCAKIVLMAIDTMYDNSPQEKLPSWTTEIGAKRALSKLGGVRGGLLKLGASQVAHGFEQTGDIIVKYEDGFPTLGVILSDGILMSTHEDGVYITSQYLNYDEVYRV